MFQDGSTMDNDHGGTTNAHDAFVILYGASTIQGGSATTYLWTIRRTVVLYSW